MVTIDGNDFPTYKTLDQADVWYTGSLQYSLWFSFSDDERKRFLVDASRLIDSQCWKGEQCQTSQGLQFPRTGLEDCCASTVIDGCEDFPEHCFYEIVTRQMVAVNAMTLSCGEYDSAVMAMIPPPKFSNLPETTMKTIGCWIQSKNSGNNCSPCGKFSDECETSGCKEGHGHNHSC